VSANAGASPNSRAALATAPGIVTATNPPSKQVLGRFSLRTRDGCRQEEARVRCTPQDEEFHAYALDTLGGSDDTEASVLKILWSDEIQRNIIASLGLPR
jgi:hypothetical protein